MKNTRIYIILFILFFGCETSQKNIEEDLLLGEWKWSCEVVDGNYNNRVYRHSDDEDIRQCRGVETFTFHADGKFDSYKFFCFSPGLNDKGEWEFYEKELFLYYKDSLPIVYDVIKLDEKQLILNQ